MSNNENICPYPLDHQIVEAVIAWAQADPAMRDETWARVVDLLNIRDRTTSPQNDKWPLDPAFGGVDVETADLSGIAASATTEPSYAENAPRSPMSTPGAISREPGTSPVCGGLRRGGGGLGGQS